MKTEAEIKAKIKNLEEDIAIASSRKNYDVDSMAGIRNCARMTGKKFLEWVLE